METVVKNVMILVIDHEIEIDTKKKHLVWLSFFVPEGNR